MKKLFISALGVCTTLTLVVSPSSIKATDFEATRRQVYENMLFF